MRVAFLSGLIGVAALANPGLGKAAELSTYDSLMISDSRLASDRPHVLSQITFLPDRLDHASRLNEDNTAPTNRLQASGVFQLTGMFGVVVDASSGVPRMRGLSISPTEYMRIEARGRFHTDPRSIGAELSVHFSF